jgi:hypothetical protein
MIGGSQGQPEMIQATGTTMEDGTSEQPRQDAGQVDGQQVSL